MKRIGLPLGATLLTIGLTLSACSSGPPSKGDLEESLTDTGVVTDDQASCVADKLLDSDLSDDELNSIADDDKSGLSSDEEENVVTALTAAVTECVTP